MEFNYQIEEKKDYNLVSISGNLIEKNQASNLLEEINELVEKDSNRFILNMQDFKYMNSTGLTILLNILTKARKSGGEAVICNVPERIKSLLVITKLNNVFSVVDSEALAAQNLN
jgi:anti-sigma B factor antagonist